MFQVYKVNSFWRELDEEIIYYQSNWSGQYLIFRNNQTGRIMYYFEIDCQGHKSLGLLNKQKQHLNVFQYASKYAKIARLHKANLNLKINYRICKEELLNQSTIQYLQNNLILFLYNRRWYQFSRNKQIRKQKQYYDEFLEESVVAKMIVKEVNSFRKEEQILNKFYIMFENIFKISIHYINSKYGRHQFKRKGDFLILEISSKVDDVFNDKYYPRVFYLHLDLIYKGQESLKSIKQFDNLIYVGIKQQSEYNIYEIKSEQKRELLYSIKDCSQFKKPILQQKHLVLTNKRWPIVYDITKENKKFKNI